MGKPFRHIWADTETTGLVGVGEIIELAASVCDDKHKVIDTFHSFVHPELRGWSAEAEKFHGITETQVMTEGLPRAEAKAKFISWLGFHGIGEDNKAMLCGQNIIAFDSPMIKEFLGDSYFQVFGHHMIDTMVNAKFINDTWIRMNGYLAAPFKLKGKPSVSLEAQRAAFGITQEGAHRAAKDVADTIACYLKAQETVIKRVERSYELDNARTAALQCKDDAELLALARKLLIRG